MNDLTENGGLTDAKKEKSDIVFFSVVSSLAVIGYVLLSNGYALAVKALGIKWLVAGSQLSNQCFSLLATMATILIPFLTAGCLERKRTDIDLMPLDKPEKPLLTALGVMSGMAVCLIGSVVTNYITLILSSLGVTLSQPSLASPMSGYALLIYIIRLTVTAALMEEICFRGIVMQPLRRYGNFFAVFMSAALFALMHCNLIQAPAAFISGIGIGYFTIATGSLWTGILIHLGNNAVVALSEYYLATGREDMVTVITNVSTAVILSVGLVSLVLFFVIRKRAGLDAGRRTALTPWQKFRTYIFTPPMIIAILLIAYLTKDFIDL